VLLRKDGTATNSANIDKVLSVLEAKFGNILEDLKQNRLIELNMENGNIGDQEIQALAKILSMAKNLKKINMRRNRITEKGVQYLCDAMISLKVEILDLSYNRITPLCFGHFKNLKSFNKKIKYINIKNNDIPTSIKRKKIAEFKAMGLFFDFK
jgi:Ran GTPase-activating protein (RanGAP) involved in mRNA processing and transport